MDTKRGQKRQLRSWEDTNAVLVAASPEVAGVYENILISAAP
jgi:hypothetical protein